MFAFLKFKSNQTRIQACLDYLFLSENADEINKILGPNIQNFAKKTASLKLSPETLATIHAARIMRDIIIQGISDERRSLIVKLFDSKIYPGMKIESKDIPEKEISFLESYFARLSHIETILSEWNNREKITPLAHSFFIKEVAASLKNEDAAVNEEILKLVIDGM